MTTEMVKKDWNLNVKRECETLLFKGYIEFKMVFQRVNNWPSIMHGVIHGSTTGRAFGKSSVGLDEMWSALSNEKMHLWLDAVDSTPLIVEWAAHLSDRSAEGHGFSRFTLDGGDAWEYYLQDLQKEDQYGNNQRLVVVWEIESVVLLWWCYLTYRLIHTSV